MIIKPNLRLPPRHLNHTINLILKLIRLVQNPLDMILPQPLIVRIPLRDRRRRKQHVSDLPTVQFVEGGFFGPVFDFGPVEQGLVVVGVFFVELLDEVVVDFGFLVVGEVAVGDGEVYAGLDGDVEGADAVCGDDEDAVVVFEDAEEDCRGFMFTEA